MRTVFEKAKVILDDGDAYLCVGIPYPEAKKFVYTMKQKQYALEITEYRERRSLDANAYCWALLGKLAAVLRIKKEDLYRQYIRDIGGNSETVCVQEKAVDKLVDGWRHNGIGWQTETMPSKIKGCVNVTLYYGSSTYDTAQMSRLIDMVVQDCKDQNIETLPPDKLAGMMEEWACTK